MVLWDETKNKIQNLIRYVETALPLNQNDEIARAGLQIHQSLTDIQNRYNELCMLVSIVQPIHDGLSFDKIMESIYESFEALIPYDRIGVALVDNEQKIVTSRWARLRKGDLKLGENHSALLSHSSLGQIASQSSPQPRILNDLESYLKEHPQSHCTEKLLEEGIRSSLTCPLIVDHKTIGFLFFSSFERHKYQDVHVEFYLEIADRVAIAFNNSLMAEKLIALNQVKDDFVSMVSHELRTPLAIIKEGTSQVLDRLHGDLAPGQERTLNSVLRNINRLGRIINDLLDVSKMEAGKLELLEEQFDIIELSRSLCANFKVLAAAKGLELVEIYKSPSQIIHADRDRLTQVFMNLTNNAIQYSEKGKIEIEISCSEQSIEWSVRDSGRGIAEKDMAKLFNKFEQFGSSVKHHTQGTGLGLSIVKNIVELHGGTIQAESKIAEGSCFKVTLPHRSLRLLLEDKLSACFNRGQNDAGEPLFLARFRMLHAEKVVKTLGRQYGQCLMRDLREALIQTLRGETDIVLCSSQEIVVALTGLAELTSKGVLKRLQDLLEQHLRARHLLDLVRFETNCFWKESSQKSDIAEFFTISKTSF